jgi:hypothetical protein
LLSSSAGVSGTAAGAARVLILLGVDEDGFGEEIQGLFVKISTV